MNTLILQGSPRKDGNTAALLNNFIEGLMESKNASIARYDLVDLEIHPCTACDMCRTDDELYCKYNDGMQSIYKDFINSDLLVLATPIYWWSVSSFLKLVIDRLYGLNPEKNPEFFKNKKLILIMSYYDQDPNSGANLVVEMFQEITKYTGVEIAGVLRYATGKVPAAECPEILSEAKTLGHEIMSK